MNTKRCGNDRSLRKQIDPLQAEKLYRQIRSRAEIVELKTIPPRCRDPKDHPVLATAIDGQANAIVTGDDDLRADEELRPLIVYRHFTKKTGNNGLQVAVELPER